MNKDKAKEITVLLNEQPSAGDDSESELTNLVYQDLKRIAVNRLQNESPDNTLTVTALVHETYLRMSKTTNTQWASRRHYFGAAASAMRRILIDRARYHLRQRREGEKFSVPLDEGLLLDNVNPERLMELNDALSDLEAHDSQLAELVQLRYFAGLSLLEISELYETSPRTVDRRWQSARAWLLMQMRNV